MNNEYQSGTVELAIGTGVITPDRLGDVVVTFTEGTRSGEPLSGNVTKPSRRWDERTITFPLFLRGIDELQVLFGDYFNASAGSKEGNIVIETGKCSVDTKTINIHPVCEPDSHVDFHTWGTTSITWNATYSGTDLLQTEVTIYCQDDPADPGKSFQVGTGDLTQDVLWNASTQTYVPVASS